MYKYSHTYVYDMYMNYINEFLFILYCHIKEQRKIKFTKLVSVTQTCLFGIKIFFISLHQCLLIVSTICIFLEKVK